MSKHLKAISLGSMALAAVGAIGWGVWHFHESRSMKTDDCRVEASIVSVGSKPAECVTIVDVEEGENVRRGQTLAHLDSRIMQARLMAARSRVKLMQARHDEMLAGFRPQEVESQRARAVQASTSLEHARRDYERIEKLVREEAGISSADRDARTGVLPGGAGGSRHAPRAGLKARASSEELSEGERYMNNLPARARDLWSMSGVLSHEVDLWGKLWARTEAARAQLLASSAARDAVYLRLTAEVASSYINVRTWEEKCLINRRVHASYEQACAMYEKRFVQGQYPELALRRVQAELSKTLAQLRLSENELSRAESVLSVLVGDSPRQVMKGGWPGGGNAALLASPPAIPARIPGDMIERRPDIWELESRLKAAFYGREAARKDRFPSLVLTGELGQVSTRLNELLNQTSRSYELGAGILQALFDEGRKRAAVRAADAGCAAVQAAYEQAVLNAFREIRDALVERRKSAEVYEASLDEVKCLHRSWDVASKQYEAGYVGLMDALDTHRSLLSGELDMADAAQMQLNAIVKFCKALGGGWLRRPGSA